VLDRLFVAYLVVAMNCGSYGKSGMEQSRFARAVLVEIVFPSFV
jgi:hypothetical protein